MRVILFSLCFVLLFFAIVSADVNVNSCSVLNVSGEKYILQNAVNSSGMDCIVINADNIVFDANGYSVFVDMSNSSGNYGLNVSGTNNSIVNFQYIDSYYFSNGSISFIEETSGKI
jgi:hypothetical protein